MGDITQYKEQNQNKAVKKVYSYQDIGPLEKTQRYDDRKVSFKTGEQASILICPTSILKNQLRRMLWI